jgi:hypothetical protein
MRHEISTEKDPKKPYFRAFEHPYVLINDSAFLHAPIWKEFGPEAMKASKSGEPWPVLFWHCPVGFCPFVQPPSSKTTVSPTNPLPNHHAKGVPRGVTTRSKAVSPTAIAASQISGMPKPRPKRATIMNANRARPGYCECCYERYSDLSKHVSSLFHRQFALEDKNYADLDRLLLQLQRPTLQQPKSAIESENNPNSTSENTVTLLRSPVSQKSTVSDCNGSIGRNYNANKRAKQTQALKDFKPHQNSLAAVDDNKENGVVVARGCNVDDEAGSDSVMPAPPTSPSFKRRRSNRVATVHQIPQLH